jgi:hypothetical protein
LNIEIKTTKYDVVNVGYLGLRQAEKMIIGTPIIETAIHM